MGEGARFLRGLPNKIKASMLKAIWLQQNNSSSLICGSQSCVIREDPQPSLNRGRERTGERGGARSPEEKTKLREDWGRGRRFSREDRRLLTCL